MQGPGAAATVHMGFLEGASDRALVGAATHGGGQEAGDMSARVAVASKGWMATVGTMAVSVLHEAEKEVGKMESKPAAEEMVEVTSKLAVETLSKRAATAEVAGVGKKMAEVAL